jgi:flavin-dependent dehydrogenase
MDNNLLRRAASMGVVVLENTSVTEVITEGERVGGVKLKQNGAERKFAARITIDATGRSRCLARRAEDTNPTGPKKSRSKLVAFKAHLASRRIDRGVCEIYSYTRGYGGSGVERGEQCLLYRLSGRCPRYRRIPIACCVD